MTNNMRKIQFGFVGFALALWGVGIALRALSLDSAGSLLFDEDMIVETATAIAFFMVFLVVALHTFRTRIVSFWLVVCGAVGLLISLEEFDYFRRIIHWEAYEFWDVRFDGVHDIPAILKSGFASDPVVASMVSVILLILCGLGLWIARRGQRRTGPPDLTSPDLRLLVLATVFIVISQFIDLHVGFLNRLLPVENALEEALEVSAAFLVLIFVIRYRSARLENGPVRSS